MLVGDDHDDAVDVVRADVGEGKSFALADYSPGDKVGRKAGRDLFDEGRAEWAGQLPRPLFQCRQVRPDNPFQ